jgi:signal transduction histidine kinase
MPQHPDRFSPELLGIISHELRSPLAAIKGYAATLRRHEQRLSRAERKQFLDAIDDASDRLTLIVERIEELAQLEMGFVALVREPIAYPRLVREAIAAAERRLAASRAAKRQCTFTFRDETGDARLLVQADLRYLRDLVDNLIENAVRYSPNGGAIELRLTPTSLQVGRNTAARAIELTISDEGIGIPEEHLTRIFGPFQRIEMLPRREHEGLGLGLAICRKIVDCHEGIMWAESTVGAGSTFHVVLPAVEDPPEP